MTPEKIGLGIRRYNKPERAQFILDEIERVISGSTELSWNPAKIGTETGEYVIDTTFRYTLFCFLERRDQYTEKTKSEVDYLKGLIDHEVDECLAEYQSDMSVYISIRDPYELLKYTENNFLEWHIDDGASNRSRVSMLYYLNDDYEGGELEFANFDGLIKPKKGDIIIFPSSFAYKHRVRKVTKGVRYVIADFMA